MSKTTEETNMDRTCYCMGPECCDVCRDWEPDEKQLLELTYFSRAQKFTENNLKKWEKENNR